jgi:DNA-binding transcriptional MerR regulator
MFPQTKTGSGLTADSRKFSSREVARISGVSIRQLQWWDERHLISPRRKDRRRNYMLPELLEVMAVVQLKRKGLSLQKIRRVLRLLRSEVELSVGKSWNGKSRLYLLTDGRAVYLEQKARRILDLLRDARRGMYAVCLSDLLARIASDSDLDRRSKKQLRLFE